MSEFIEIRVEQGIGHIILNRPSKLNALSRDLVAELREALLGLENNQAVKVIILSGNGKSFCAGGDIDSMNKLKNQAEAAEWVEFVSGLTRQILELNKYVIAAIHGYAAGAGFSLALACDFIVAEREAKFALSFANIGLIPDLGLIKLLSERISPPLVKEWISTGKTITAEEALSYQMINRLAEGDVVQEAETFAEFIVNGPSVANKYVKYLVNTAPSLHHETALMQENTIQAILLQTEDHKEGVSAFFEKRKASFIGS
ncbi:2-(1,2-epoxy-1,2-dihydrophenyl)acetyl-CoA isomerase [Neobacillus niacini]|jgi:2-(1,2-epoxy-1,2-dihydrophenyl)acetyl-CoA isomerase|uniref:enoyl-CoA hydratase/isomerase family protein n=1 Tax=Neobacillus driksii TaxID=3035913 RepID=UPI00277D2FBB|nr:enoyl-CoA hydratase/isomerase family protein [Neobacillus niacini]MDQ0970566.1 2-(1,2-epoxy-1,2-dihydrophenyl)acetyl-CoA isomerase [Neobacillus niacini]